MKLPQIFGQLLKPKTEPKKEQFLSLVLDVDHVQAALWEIDKKQGAIVRGTKLCAVVADAWDDRIKAADEALSAITPPEDTTKYSVVFGLPKEYLTAGGDIHHDVRLELKKLASMLELTPVGFVPITQALVYKLNREEGMPANVILIGIARGTVTVALYKIGNLIGQHQHALGEEPLTQIVESALRNFPDAEVLPSRMLLYGSDLGRLEEAHRELLKHAWQSKANFLHFPKIELLPHEAVVAAVSLAGASELASTMGEEVVPAEVPVAASEITASPPDTADETLEKDAEHIHTAVEDHTPPEESNVVLVDPQELGFGAEPTEPLSQRAPMSHARLSSSVPTSELEDTSALHEPEERPGDQSASPAVFERLRESFRRVHLPSLEGHSWPALPMGPVLPLALLGIGLLVILGLVYWLVPAATVTVLQLPKPVEASGTFVIDPSTTAADPAKKIIPGVKQEQSVSGEKTIPVTGKKEVGDPARGSVTVYNKSLASRTFHKGSVLVSHSLSFTLDDDISVASASESIGSITFGKANATVTAKAVGKDSNLPANSEFTFKDVSDSIAIARNDKALAGGTSREVTVVSRGDQDALVKALSDELVTQAKQQLTQNVTGGQQLIDATIKTQVTAKTFTQELDQEAEALNGKLTLTVSGIAYNDADLAALLEDGAKSQVSPGYSFSSSKPHISVKDPKVAKDGKITVVATYQGETLPMLDSASIRKAIAGKNLIQVQDYLKNLTGVAGVMFEFHRSPWTDRLPANGNNVTVRIAVQ